MGTNNCNSRYRTLSGGIGESPSPTPSSDYEENVAAATHNCGNAASGSNKSNMNSNNLSGSSGGGGGGGGGGAAKTKRSNTISAHNSNSSNSSSSKSQQISQKATVHYVSRVALLNNIFQTWFRSVQTVASCKPTGVASYHILDPCLGFCTVTHSLSLALALRCLDENNKTDEDQPKTSQDEHLNVVISGTSFP